MWLFKGGLCSTHLLALTICCTAYLRHVSFHSSHHVILSLKPHLLPFSVYQKHGSDSANVIKASFRTALTALCFKGMKRRAHCLL